MSDRLAEAHRGACRSCGASILWTVLPSGKRTPLDAKPRTAYVQELERFVQVYASHFATCPQATSWRVKQASLVPEVP